MDPNSRWPIIAIRIAAVIVMIATVASLWNFMLWLPWQADCGIATAAAFAFDREALTLSLEGLQLAADAALDPLERLFFYLPLEHAESVEVQDAAVEAFGRLVSEAPPELRGYCEYCGKFAQQHRDIIAKFGRFPHRNRILDRESTPAELEWLASGGANFGQ